MTYQTHIRQVLAPSIMAVQWLTIVVWLATLLLNPHLQRPLDHAYALAFAALLGTAASSALARRFWQWRLSGALYVLALAAAYRLELHGMGRHGDFWLLPVSVTLCLGVNLLFLFSRDYLLVLACTWSIMLVAHPAPIPARSDLPLLALLVAAVSLIGFALNRMFVRSMRTTFALQEDYRRISETDALTGLANRRALTEQLQTLAAAHGERALHFAMLDIDDFKQVNDTHGHDVGDAVLLALAAELARLGDGCRVGRLGGEEFGILFERMSDAQVGELLHRLLDRVCMLRVNDVAFAFSAGVARLHPGGTVSDLLKRADRALYAAKREGKGRIRIEAGAGATTADRASEHGGPLPQPSE
ncbi:GGDEF domain-containing protein [Xanthomonas bonasiae]|uniref:GGDEF domain-containing protein n=1 Tax=Xanthomonas bonasiae TaxID=2810351 RepID=UPI00177BCA5C|nr:GGDEF domain-containing protein [Xanthomonas surreyensis]MBD7922792.1 GGDEF domain-containing protein [Xanthomonas surreyensis]